MEVCRREESPNRIRTGSTYRKRAFKKEGKADGIEELKKKIEFMLQTMDQKGLEQAYKILQRIWIRHGTQQ